MSFALTYVWSASHINSRRYMYALIYHKILIISPGLIFVQKAFLLGLFSGELIFRGGYYWKEFCILKWVGPYNKNSLKEEDNSLKQLKIASTNSPWAYIREGLLSKGFLHLRFGGLIFGEAYFLFCFGGAGGLLAEFYGIFFELKVSYKGPGYLAHKMTL